MKNLLKVFGVIALIAVIGFSAAACSEPDEGGGGPVHFGDTLELSGDVYTVEYVDDYIPKYTKFTGDLKLQAILSEASGEIKAGEIKGGKLTYTIGIPTSLSLTAITGLKSTWTQMGFTDIVISEESAKVYYFSSIQVTGSNDYNNVYKGEESGSVNGTNFSGTDESVMFIYVDKDVKVTAKGKTETEDDGSTEKLNDLNISLQKGWNAVHIKESMSGNINTQVGSWTTTISKGNPNLKWVLD